MPDTAKVKHREFFRRNGYLAMRHVLSTDFCAFVRDYARLRASLDPGSPDKQVPGAHSVYADPLMETLERLIWPRLEKWIGESLWPTYSYHRVYRTGDLLAAHTDRPSCEISVSLCLGFDHGEQKARYRWPLLLDPLPSSRPGTKKATVSCRMDPGDLVVYLGPQVKHWRTRFEGAWHVQVFLHYVRREGLHASLLKFDGRPALGAPIATRTHAQERQQRLRALMQTFADRQASDRANEGGTTKGDVKEET